MKKGKTHQINEKGKRLLNEQLPCTWVSNEHFNDYGKDFLVEIGDENGELHGESFFIQLKSSQSPIYLAKDESVSFQLNSRYARYFAKINDLPVFLVIMDVSRSLGYYLFLQEWLASNQGYQSKSSVSVPVPQKNLLTETKVFEEEIARSKEWLRTRYPASLQNAAEAEVSRIRSLDPRFNVKTTYESGNIRHELLANTAVQTTFQTLEGRAEAHAKLKQFLDFGDTVYFQPGEFTIDGSSLLKIAEQSGCQLSMNPVNAKLKVSGEDATTSPNSLVFDGRILCGERRIQFTSVEANNPISLQVEVREHAVGFTLRFDAKKWEGVKISRLPFFASCKNLLNCLTNSQSLEFVLECEGFEVVRVPCPVSVDSRIKAISGFIADVERTRKFCAFYKVDPSWSMGDFYKQYHFFCQFEALTFNEQWTGPAILAEARCVITCNHLKNEIKALRKYPGPFTITSSMSFNFLGLQIPIGRIANDFTFMKLKKCRKIRQTNDYDVHFVATAETTLTMRKAESGK